jgi:hypothetical protein
VTVGDRTAQSIGVLGLTVYPDVGAPDSLLLATALCNASRDRHGEKGEY